MRKFLNRVTITGADDSTDIDLMVAVSKARPWVEWGILLSESSMGKKPRFPSKEWLARLCAAKAENPGMRLSAHVCGAWARQFAKDGGIDFKFDLGFMLSSAGAKTSAIQHDIFVATFGRVQINVRSERAETDVDAVARAIRDLHPTQVIFQSNDANDWLLEALDGRSLNVVGLADKSGGKGVLPGEWPEDGGPGWGYAGGLTPDNLREQIEKIERVSGDGAWIDAEAGLRADDKLDMGLVGRFLDIASAVVKVARMMHVPVDAVPLDPSEEAALFEDAFDADGKKVQMEAFDRLEFGTYQRLLITLDAANQHVGRLRHWFAHAGGNVKKPDAEARVLFLALNNCHDLLLAGDKGTAFPLVEKALYAVALSRAGKRDLDMAFWGQVETRMAMGKKGSELVEDVGSDEPIGIPPTPMGSDDGPVGFGFKAD